MCLKPQTTIFFPTICTPQILEVNTYNFGKAGFDNMVKMLETAYSCSSIASTNYFEELKEVYDEMFTTWKSFSRRVTPIPWEEVITTKDKKTSTGYPLCLYIPEYGSYIEKVGQEQFLKWLETAENHLLAGGILPTPHWRPFPKQDKYSSSKVKANDLRMVSTGPLFLLLLSKRYYGEITEFLEKMLTQYYLATTAEQYERKVCNRLFGKRTIGIDYTGFDKHSIGVTTFLSFQLLHRFTAHSVPEPIFEYIAKSIMHPCSIIIDPHGTPMVYPLAGSNPSGQLFTTWCNTTAHLAHNALYLKLKMNINVSDYLNDHTFLVTVATGDDGVEGFPTDYDNDKILEIANELADFIYEYFGIPAKLDLMYENGQRVPFPPELMAPYLNQIVVPTTNGDYYKIPVHVERLLPSLIFYDKKDAPHYKKLAPERAMGIYNEVKPLIFHEMVQGTPRNRTKEVLVELIRSTGTCMPESIYDINFNEGVLLSTGCCFNGT